VRIAVIGANGRTGRLVVRQARARSVEVVAVARRHEAAAPEPGLARVTGDVLDRERLAGALDGVDAVVSAVGIGTSRQPTELYSAGTANLLGAMAGHGIKRLVVLSALPVGPRQEQPFADRRIVLPVLEAVFGATYRDMRRMEAALRDSTADWTALRPPRLVAAPVTGKYRLDAARPLPRARVISYADLATAVLDVVKRDDLSGRAAYVAH
jgi:putative NADH-flavin reductase